MDKIVKSSRIRMANRIGKHASRQVPGFKLVFNEKTQKTDFVPNRAKRRQAAALRNPS